MTTKPTTKRRGRAPAQVHIDSKHPTAEGANLPEGMRDAILACLTLAAQRGRQILIARPAGRAKEGKVDPE